MRWPKLRELKEAVIAVFSPRFTTRFPAEPCVVPPKYRGKPEFDDEKCIGCGACVNVCPTEALTQTETLDSEKPLRIIKERYDTCIFCGSCAENCTTEDGIKMSNEWDLAGLDRAAMSETHEYELQLCEKCGAVVGTKKHLAWLYDQLGPLAYTNPAALLAKKQQLSETVQQTPAKIDEILPGDYMKILCPECKCELNIRF